MKASLSKYEKDLDDLLQHVYYLQAEEQFFRTSVIAPDVMTSFESKYSIFLNEVVSPSITRSKRYIYNSIIISLYGFMEGFIELLIEKYVKSVSEIAKGFDKLPKPIQAKHTELSIEYFKLIERTRLLTSEQLKESRKTVISNLHKCLNLSDEYKINSKAFSQHTANLRYDAIHMLFTQIGISNVSSSALHDKEFKKHLAARGSLPEDAEHKLLLSRLMFELDDLAQRRNEISHGWANDDLESYGLYSDRITLLKSYGTAIYEIVNNHFQDFLFDAVENFNLGRPTQIYSKKKAFGFKLDDVSPQLESRCIKKGCRLFAVNSLSKNRLKSGFIKSMVLNREAVDVIQIKPGIEFAVCVDFDVTTHMNTREIHIEVA